MSQLTTSGSGLGLGHSRHLPTWAPYGVLVLAAAFSAAVLALAGFNLAGFLVLTAITFMIVLVVASRAVEGPRKATDRFVTSLVVGSFLLALVPLISVAWTVISRGAARLDVEFFTFSMRGIVGEGGGAAHALAGTLIITAITTLISVPIGILTAVYLVEYGRGSLARAITFLVDVMTGIPSIVAGLFALALFVLILGPSARLGIMGSVALCVLMIPVVVRSTEEILRLVPHELREASYALGVPKWRTVVKVVLRTSVAGIATGVTLAIARVIGETAPLLVTVGFTAAINYNPFDGRMATLPTFSWFSYAAPSLPVEASIDRAWTAALVLVILVMAFNLLARVVSRAFSPKTR
ncbi:phosphate ABC transporter membrane protein 2, PhoT family [Quadrisphaera granulorum]|uniref:Phosphate transport system permease protein PstA n=1 Tax=Quadrisphaera granulorum TaxID=317664 RepID=A0A316A1R4_9ACTN|nr:phosphate ABC transporter permease PstA [Quadrisphaera granulorum]PWJ51791.1 phosphate ABC transporter membrane protein 2 (PhoT family) [Quadrisphaera granulorum]SZE97738.1 phosphate ABC transporter membrane protein 2, PhoT family [Quadrisphaera granulorum]